MYLSFSGFKKWDGCKFAYWNGYINNTTVEGPDDRLGSIFGSAVGGVFEDFYTGRFWKEAEPRAATFARVAPQVAKCIKQETTATKWRQAGVLMWKGDGEGQKPRAMYTDQQELEADVRDAVERGLRIIRHYRLLGPQADAEVKLDYTLDGHKLGGRADFIIKRTKPHRDMCIIDGKGSRHRDKYVDRRQLFWYGMLYQLHYGELPDRLGFLFWRYDPPESFDWVDFSSEDIDELRETVLATIREIEELTAGLAASPPFDAARKVFLPIAETKVSRDKIEQACRFCPYATEAICPEGRKVQKKFA